MKHVAGTPCSHCTFGRNKTQTECVYAYIIAIHYGNTSYSRDMRKSAGLRGSNVKNDDSVFSGTDEGRLEAIGESGR